MNHRACTILTAAALAAIGAASNPARAQNVVAPPPSPEEARTFLLSRVERMPELANGGAVERALRKHYPPQARDRGESGTVMLRFRVLANGSVDSASVAVEGSDAPEFADAAMAVARMMRFRPARTRQGPVAAWVQQPITFRSEAPRRLPTTPASEPAPPPAARP
jgi:TonB family protein